MRWVVGVGLHGYWLGTYEWRKQRLFSQAVTHGAVVYDIGANSGFYSMLAARRTGANGRVHAFEPNPRNVATLWEHVRLNRLSQVTVHPLALADSPGEMNFDDTNSFSGRLSQFGSCLVTTTTLDLLLESHMIEPPTIVKLDVEGAELAALQGGHQTLATHRPLLFLATHARTIHKACCDMLGGLGYRFHPIEPGDSLESTDELIAQPI